MMKQYVNKENLKVVGDAGYRIGKDIVREGTKAVIGKAAGAVLAVTLKEGFGGIKKIDLDTVLGDITRIEKKLNKKIKKSKKKIVKGTIEESKKRGLDLSNEEVTKGIVNQLNDELEKKGQDIRIELSDIIEK